MGDQLTLTRGPFYTEMSYLISPNPLLLKDTAPINTNTYAGALLLVGGPSGRLWALHACLSSPFMPFGRSSRVTHAGI